MGNCCENNTVKNENPDDLTGNKINEVSENMKEGTHQTEILEEASKQAQPKEVLGQEAQPEAELDPNTENVQEHVEFDPSWNRPIPKAKILNEFTEIPASVNEMLEKYKDNEHMEKICIPIDPTKPMLGPFLIGKF